MHDRKPTTAKASASSFEAMGTTVNLRVQSSNTAARRALSTGRASICEFDSALSRFDPRSELSQLNADPRETVEATWLMCEFLDAALWAAEASGGLVDPTLVTALENCGYAETRTGATPAPIGAALEIAPNRQPASPSRTAGWQAIRVDRWKRQVRRPRGMKIDSGGSGKGLAADLLARKWTVDLMSDGRVPNFMIDCGGDIRFGGRNPHGYVNVTDPFDHRAIALPVNSGAVATSSIAGRIWETSDGHAHHLIDPATGEPAWTGVVQTTALAPSALIAETLSKVALLRGPEGAREVLAGFGGLFITDDGEVEYVPQAEEAIAA